MPFRTYSEILNNIKLFEGVAAEERDKLLSQGQIRHLQEGEVLFRCGDAIDHFYIVCAGAVRLMRETPDGKQVTTDIPITGKTIGKPDILRQGTRITVSPPSPLNLLSCWYSPHYGCLKLPNIPPLR